MNRTTKALLLATTAALVVFVIHVSLGGSVPLSPGDILYALTHPVYSVDDRAALIVWQIRLPRAVGGLLIGGVLGAVGAAFQAYFRNPLAEPYVIGVSSGAALGGTLALIFGLGGLMFGLALPVFGCLGGLGALYLVLAVSGSSKGASRETLLISGVVIGAVLAALMSLSLILGGQDTNMVLQWLLGSLAWMTWPRAIGLTVAALLVPVIYSQSRALNAVAADDKIAAKLGVDRNLVQKRVLLTGAAAASLAVGAAGIIPFIGLISPHCARLMTGPDVRKTIPVSAAIGAVLLLAADILAQKIKTGVELPVGAVTALLGAPLLLFLLRSNRR